MQDMMERQPGAWQMTKLSAIGDTLHIWIRAQYIQ